MGFLTKIKGIFLNDYGMIVSGENRSPKWSKARMDWLKSHPNCAVCNGKEKLEVHHIIPFHLDRTKELDPTNLITLCSAKSHDDHFIFGHLMNFSRSNPDVVKDAQYFNLKIGAEKISEKDLTHRTD